MKVGWDESTAGKRQPCVSLWEIEPLTTFPMYPSLFPLHLKLVFAVIYLQSPGVLAIGSSMKGQNSYSHHLILMLVSQLWIGSRFIH
ncbi:putative auxin response factor [Helianthus annuus]|nr:putative auxin response factor [Helianthus annuus]